MHPGYGGSVGQVSISCFRCGDMCKGEVVRVQNEHFHVKCFTCQGMELYMLTHCVWSLLGTLFRGTGLEIEMSPV